MTDERTEYGGPRPGAFDDDRLLAYALGLDDDPELRQAAETDADLGSRLAAMHADVDTVGAQVRAAVPEPDDSYTDLSGERWGGLKEHLELPERAAAPRRERRWWRVVAPVAAIAVLALVVGIVAVDQGDRSATSGSSAEVARSAQDSAAPAGGKSEDAATGAIPGSSPAPPAVPQTAAQRLVDQLDRFATVVLARARQATGALQRFAVLKIFKGDAPQVVELEVDGQPADEGRLHLLMLDPMQPDTEDLESPEPVPSLATARDYTGLGQPLAVSYTYRGEATMVREFAAGTDPDTVTMPVP
jgi:hypothetical protein